MTYDRTRFVLADLEFHIRRPLVQPQSHRCVDDLLDALAASGDIYAITTRGNNWRRCFELDLRTLSTHVKRSQHWRMGTSDPVAIQLVRGCDGRSLYLIHAQEVLVRERFDIVAVGSRSRFSDGIPLRTLCEATTSSGGFSVLGHPYRRPNSVLNVPRRDANRVRHAGRLVDAIATFNQQIGNLRGYTTHRARQLAIKLGKPAIAVSDYHLYRRRPARTIVHSGVLLPRKSYMGVVASDLIDLLHSNIVSDDFVALEQGLPCVRDIVSLGFGEALYLFRQGLPWSGSRVADRALRG